MKGRAEAPWGRLLAVMLALLAGCALAVSAYEWVGGEDDPDVLVLTDATFDAVIKEEKVVLAEFYAPWCGHCKKLAPEYAAAATALKEAGDPRVVLAKIDATENKALAERYGVSGYPTLKIFKDGQLAGDYPGGRTKDSIVETMRKRALPDLVEVQGADALTALVDGARVASVVAGFFKDKSAGILSKTLYAKLKDLATAHADLANVVATCAEPGVCEKALGIPDGRIALVQPQRYAQSKSETRVLLYDPKVHGDDLDRFVRLHSAPLVGDAGEDLAFAYHARGKPVVVASFPLDWNLNPKAANYVANRMRKVALLLGDAAADYSFAIAKVGPLRAAKELYGLEDGADAVELSDRRPQVTVAMPTEKGLTTKAPHVMPYEDGFSPEAVAAFVKRHAAGETKARVKSEADPGKQAPGEVTIATGDNFGTVIDGATSDVLLEIYAPWCGHCKKLAPEYEVLAQRFAPVADKVVIAKIDATANDPSAAFAYTGFPTLYWKPLGGAPVKYDGGRTAKDLEAYILKHSTAKISKGDLAKVDAKAPSEEL